MCYVCIWFQYNPGVYKEEQEWQGNYMFVHWIDHRPQNPWIQSKISCHIKWSLRGTQKYNEYHGHQVQDSDTRKPQIKQFREKHKNIQEPFHIRTLQCGYGLPPSTTRKDDPKSNNNPQPAATINATPKNVCLHPPTWIIWLQPHTACPTRNKRGVP